MRAPVTAAAPATIDSLIARLSTNPSATGEKGLDLLKRLEELQASNGNDQAARAAQLTREIERWVGRGRLDPATGSLATRLLAPLASHAGEKGRGEEGGD
jgi:hypothetical protein